MPTPAFPVAFTISDNTPDGRAAFPFLILLIDFLTMSLSIKRGTPLTISVLDKLFPSKETLGSKASHDGFSKHFSCTAHQYYPN